MKSPYTLDDLRRVIQHEGTDASLKRWVKTHFLPNGKVGQKWWFSEATLRQAVNVATGIKALRERPRLGRRPKEPLLARERLEELLADQRLEELMVRLTEIKEEHPPIRTSSGEVISLKRKKPK